MTTPYKLTTGYFPPEPTPEPKPDSTEPLELMGQHKGTNKEIPAFGTFDKNDQFPVESSFKRKDLIKRIRKSKAFRALLLISAGLSAMGVVYNHCSSVIQTTVPKIKKVLRSSQKEDRKALELIVEGYHVGKDKEAKEEVKIVSGEFDE